QRLSRRSHLSRAPTASPRTLLNECGTCAGGPLRWLVPVKTARFALRIISIRRRDDLAAARPYQPSPAAPPFPAPLARLYRQRRLRRTGDLVAGPFRPVAAGHLGATGVAPPARFRRCTRRCRSEEHTSELQSR